MEMISRYPFTDKSHNVKEFYEHFSDFVRCCIVEYFNYHYENAA